MYSLYVEWNQQINVISRKDMDGFYVRHVLHALALAKFISFVPGTQILDVGTGGGFPGVPLAVFFPKVHFHLVDSIGKKIKVFRVERLTKEDKTFEFLIYDGPELLKGALKKEVVTFFETHDEQYSFFDGELKTWKKIK